MNKIFAWIGGVLAVVVVGTGVYVTVRYRPDASGAALVVQKVHGLAAIGLGLVVVVGLAAFVWERRPDRRHGLPAFAVVAVLAVAFVVETTVGWGLAWDQLALWAVTVGADLRGALVSSSVKFVLIDGRALGRGEYRRLVWIHIAVLPVLIGIGTGFVVGWTRRFGRPEARPRRDDG